MGLAGARDAMPRLPRSVRTSLIYMDESGSKASGSRFFVVAAAKLRNPGQMHRALQDVRDRTAFGSEFKFSDITRGALSAYYALIEAIEQTDLHLAACVVNKGTYDPFQDGSLPTWRVHADVAAQLLVGCINRGEIVSVLMDGISTPRDVALDDYVRDATNRRLRSMAVASVACLDSRAADGLQVADLLASAVAFDRRRAEGESGRVNSNKAKVAARLAAALGVTNFDDQRCERVNIQTFRGRVRSDARRVAKVTRIRPAI